MPGNIINVRIETHGLEGKMDRKSSEVQQRINKFKKDLLNMAQRVVRRRAPRGKTGLLARSVSKDNNGVFVSKNVAGYRDFVINGRGAFCAKNRKRLAFMYQGKMVFPRCVKAAKAQPFVDEAIPEVQTNVNNYTREFESWLGSL